MDKYNAFQRLTILALCGALSVGSVTAYGQEKPYTEGSIWFITMIRVKPGMLDVYMRDVLPLRKKINEEAKKQGLILSDRVFSGSASGRDDFDVMFMTEYKNWAALDGISAKYEAIESRIIGSEERQIQLMSKRAEIREILGEKAMQELTIK
ncbi:MAG TPA: hypothetical protein VFJ68_10225 [Casimicrobiaceae bacterium]|nr:hypothetical protein [Casimicrobiaceae bacterium]